MKNYAYTGIFLVMIMFITGCTKDDLATEAVDAYEPSFTEGPKAIKVSGDVAGAPLFDLAVTPNGEVLVANASAGITDLQGVLMAKLAGISSMAPIGKGSIWATRGPSGDTHSDTGQALFMVHNRNTHEVANLFEFEANYNPDGKIVDSNPYAVAALNSSEALVVDAGGNDLLRVHRNGTIGLIAVFPEEDTSTDHAKELFGCPGSGIPQCNLPPTLSTEAVPTSVVIGPDGYYYVGELKGFPAPTGESHIWKISPNASGAMCGSDPDCVKLFDGGFTSIIDMVFDENGILYVAEMDSRGWLAAEMGLGEGGVIKACDPQTLTCETIAVNIPLLTAITFDKEGNLWATKYALIPAMADVVQIPL